MPLESPGTINTLNPLWPDGALGDKVNQGDNHIRLVKYDIQTTWPNVAGAITATHTEHNFLVGVTSAIQTQLDAKVAANNAALTGIPTAPTAAIGTNTTQIASTAFVISQVATGTTPAGPGDAGKFWYYTGSGYTWQPAPTPMVVRVPRTSNVNITAANRSDWIDVTSGTFTQTSDTAAALGAGFWCELGNSGSGVVTFGTLAIYQGQRYRLQSDGTTIRTTALADEGAIVVRDEKASGTAGGAFTAGSWATRTLNATQSNTISGAALVTNMVTLPAGVYDVHASAPGHFCGVHKVRLFNFTSSSPLFVGDNNSAGVSGAGSRAVVSGRVVLTATTAIRLDHWCTVTRTLDGLGQAATTGDVEVYAEMRFTKVG